jgi:hypothetical protein
MRTICDYALKFVLLFFVLARFLSGPAPESKPGESPVQEPSTDTQT